MNPTERFSKLKQEADFIAPGHSRQPQLSSVSAVSACFTFLHAGLGLLLTPNGTNIPAMYPFWLLGLLILYPLCLWFGCLKQRQPATSILRLF